MIDKQNIQKILLLRMDRIGDMLCTTPAFRAVREAYPDAQIDLVTSTGNYAVVADNPHVDNIIAFPLKKYWLWPYYAVKLRFGGYDLAVAFNGRSKTTSRLLNFINPKYCIGSEAPKTKGYYDETLKSGKEEHTIDFMLRMATAVGGQSDDTSMVFPVDEALVKRAWDRFPKKEGRKRVAIFIGNAKKKDTRWREDRFVELTERLKQRDDVELVIVAGPGDEKLLGGFTWTEHCSLYPGGSLKELAAYFKTCDMFVTSSTGPMHLAAAMDVPMVAILADFTMACWRPLADIHTLVESGLPGVQVNSVTVDEVYEAVSTKLDG